MKLMAQEIALMVYSMKYTTEMTSGVTNTGVSIEVPKERKFSDEELSMALPLFGKFKKCVQEDKYIDEEVDLNTEEKAFLLKLINRPWTLQDGEVYLPLKSKLNK